MNTFSYKKAGLLLKSGLLLIVLGLFSSPSYAFWDDWFQSCEEKYNLNAAEAIWADDISCADEILAKADKDFNNIADKKDQFGYTPLMHAIQKQLKDMVYYLIHKKADPFVKSKNGFTAKDFAFDKSKEGQMMSRIYEHRELISSLVPGEQRESLEEQVRLWEAELEKALEDGPDFYDVLSEEIYYIIVQYEASYRRWF